MRNREQLNIFDERAWQQRFQETLDAYNAIKSSLKNIESPRFPTTSAKSQNLKKANDLYTKQMIVVFCTYIETMLKDFFYTIYREHHESRQKIFSKDYPLELNKFLSKKTLPKKIIEELAEEASRKAFTFNINELLNNVCKIKQNSRKEKNSGSASNKCGQELEEMKKNLKIIFDARNKIIHENKEYNQDLGEFIAKLYEKIAPKLIKELGEICEHLEIFSTKEIKKNHDELMELLMSF